VVDSCWLCLLCELRWQRGSWAPNMLAVTGLKSDFGYFFAFFTFYCVTFGCHGPFFGPNFFGANSGSRGYQNGSNWGVNGVITLKCGCYPLQRPPATLHVVIILGHCDTRIMRLKSNVIWAYSRPMGPQQLVGAGFSSTLFAFTQWCIFCFSRKVLFGKSCTMAVSGAVTLDIYVHSCALVYAHLRLLYHILYLLHACFWLKIASLAVVSKMLKV
jgi:hypothetical protein